MSARIRAGASSTAAQPESSPSGVESPRAAGDQPRRAFRRTKMNRTMRSTTTMARATIAPVPTAIMLRHLLPGPRARRSVSGAARMSIRVRLALLPWGSLLPPEDVGNLDDPGTDQNDEHGRQDAEDEREQQLDRHLDR